MKKTALFIIIILALFLAACSLDKDDVNRVKSNRMGILPPQTPELLQEEWKLYRAQHADINEAQARHDFDVIQLMSAQEYDSDTAIWAERRAYAKEWLKTQIEDVYSVESITDEFIQSAVDAYAFKSGNPALVTASHILIKPDDKTTPEERFEALNTVLNELKTSGEFTNEALQRETLRLTKAGFHSVFNADLTFPRYPMTSFLGEQLPYQAVVEPFAEAAFSLSEQNRLSPVIESEFGYHIILFQTKTDETKADPVADREFIISNIIKRGRTLGTEQTLNALVQNSEILVNETRMQEIAGKVVEK